MKTADDNFDWNDFSIGFWHPFGPHGDENPEEILSRKAAEVSDNHSTLWSFKFFRQETLHLWASLIRSADASAVYVLCSDSKPQNSTLPSRVMEIAEEYKSIDDAGWKPIPNGIEVTFHPTGDGVATAFVVKQVIPLSLEHRQPPFLVERFSLEQKSWRSDLGGKHEGALRLPTRNESLIKRGGKTAIPSVQAVLELTPPFVVAIR